MEKSDIQSIANDFKDNLIKWRRDFHEHPEIGLDCTRTASLVAEELKKLHYHVKTGYARTGMIATIGQGKPVIAMRIDMDALPLEEKTGLAFSSKTKGLMHACGHDGHLALGLGVAHAMSLIMENINGKFILIFQPGEEHPGGAEIMIKEGVLDGESPEIILGMHIFPSLPAGKIGLRYGVMTASDNEITIEINGEGGHGAYPHLTRDPFPAAAALISAIQTITSRDTSPLDSVVVSLGSIKGGESHNVIPESIVLKGTIRALNADVEENVLCRLNSIACGIEKAFQIKVKLNVTKCGPSMVCDERITRLAEDSLSAYFGKEMIMKIDEPSMGFDDFSFFSNIIPATYLRLGSYDCDKGYDQPLHTSRFDFNEDLLVKWLEALLVFLHSCYFK